MLGRLAGFHTRAVKTEFLHTGGVGYGWSVVDNHIRTLYVTNHRDATHRLGAHPLPGGPKNGGGGISGRTANEIARP